MSITFREFLTEREDALVIQIHGLGDYEDPDHDGYFSGGRQGNLIVPLNKAMRYPSEREAVAAAQLTIDTLHDIIHDEDSTHDKRFADGHTVVIDDNGNPAFEVDIRSI